MLPRLLLLAPLVLLLLATSTWATQNQSQAVKFDEFNDIQHSDLIARLDNLLSSSKTRQTQKASSSFIAQREICLV